MKFTDDIYQQSYEQGVVLTAAEKRKAKIVGSLILSVFAAASIKAASFSQEVSATQFNPPPNIEKTTKEKSKNLKHHRRLHRLKNAIGQLESNHNHKAVNSRTGAYGTYQIMPENWAPWSNEVFGKTVSKSRKNQEVVATHKLGEYLQKFESSKLAAVAWFAGPAAAEDLLAGDKSVLNRSDGNITVKEYVAIIMDDIAEQKVAP